MPAPPVAILLLAAGAARRMGPADKLLQPVDGVPLLRRQAAAALATGLPVMVTLPVPGPARRAALAGLAATAVDVPDAAEGMAASIRAGAAACPPGAAGLMLLPADMPEIDTADITLLARRFAEAGADTVTRGTAADGTPGHPVVFPARLLPALARLKGDTGARTLLQTEPVQGVALPARHALTDLDTPEDWARWRATRKG